MKLPYYLPADPMCNTPPYDSKFYDELSLFHEGASEKRIKSTSFKIKPAGTQMLKSYDTMTYNTEWSAQEIREDMDELIRSYYPLLISYDIIFQQKCFLTPVREEIFVIGVSVLENVDEFNFIY